ncbi:unnamed protein product, partial [Candidula unifasciata]
SNHCTVNPCQNGGQCVNVQRGFACVCAEGYSGDTCERAQCTSNPCQNGGTCENGGRNFVCRCPPGFAGKDCSR